MQTFDFEGTSLFQVGSTAFTAGAGLRYLEIEQQQSASVGRRSLVPVGTRIILRPEGQRVRTRSEFDGIGPTFSLAAVQPALGGFSFYTRSRMSVLFGDREQQVSEVTTINFVAQPAFIGREDRDDKTVSIGEGGVGMMHTYENFFLTSGWEGQMWWNAGGSGFGGATAEDIALQGLNAGGEIVW